MPSFTFSIPDPFGRLLARKRVPASELARLVEQQRANEAARVVFALRLADPQMSTDALIGLAAQAMKAPIGMVDRSDAVPRTGSWRLYLICESLDRGEVEVAYRRSNRNVASTVISRDGQASQRGYMEFGDLT